MTDMLGRPAKAYQYDAYGAILAEQGPSLNDEFAYTARKLHDRSGLYYYRARFYSPELGRFITQDPIGYLGGTNLYAYVGNNPVNWVDPLGLLTICEVVSVLVPPALNATLALVSPPAALGVGGLEFLGAIYLWSEELRYQQSRRDLLEMIANADHLTPEQKVEYMSGIPVLSEAGYRGAQMAFSAWTAWGVAAAKYKGTF